MKKTLKDLGFSTAEGKIYQAGLKLGPSLVRTLAQEARITRTLAYHAINALMQRGLASKINTTYAAMFQMASVERIKEVIDRKQKELEALKTDIDFVSVKLGSLEKKTKGKIRVRVFEGIEGLKNVAQDILKTKAKKVQSLASIKGVLDTVDPSFLRQWFEEVEKHGIKSQSIWSAKNIDSAFQHSRRDLRIAPEGMEFSSTIILYDDTVAVCSGGLAIFAFVVENKEYAKTMKAIFNQIWNNSKEVK